MKERKTEITVETYEVLIRRSQGLLNRAWCGSCGKRVAIISMNDASSSGLTTEAAQREVEAGRIHLIAFAGDPSFICLNSLIGNQEKSS